MPQGKASGDDIKPSKAQEAVFKADEPSAVIITTCVAAVCDTPAPVWSRL